MTILLWAAVSLTDKISCRQVRDLVRIPFTPKNQLVSWPDGYSNHHGADAISSNTIETVKKRRKKEMTILL